MITIICGEPGRGKTALMTYFAYVQMVEKGFEDYWNSCQRIDILKAGGFNNLKYLPYQHTVYADYIIGNEYLGMQSYYVDGFKVALTNPFFDTAFFAPYSNIYLDEAQKYYDSRMSKYLRECVYRFYQLHRHNHLNIYMTCQRLGNIDLNIRGMSERIIYVEALKISKDSYGQITNMKWVVSEFNSLKDAEKHVESFNVDNKENIKTYEFKGDIFQLYNSYGNEPAFYDGNYSRSYDCYTEEGYVETIDSYMVYNRNHMYYAPVGFWKNEVEDKKIIKSRGYM